jgi:hypothetical protein
LSSLILARHRRSIVITAVTLGVSAATVLSMAFPSAAPGGVLPRAAKELARSIQGVADGGAGSETGEIKAALGQFNDMRNAPGLAKQGGYSEALSRIGDMSSEGGAWQEMTNVPYNADDHRYFDFFANTGSGGGYVTGRVQALASGGGFVYAAGAAGGLFRKPVGQSSAAWESIQGNVGALTAGALAYRNGALWFATGDGASGGTTYTGDGIWMLADATGSGPFNWVRVNDGDPTYAKDSSGSTYLVNDGTNLFDGSVINQLRVVGGWIYAATDYGVWRHDVDSTSGNWHRVFVPVPSALPSTNRNAQTNAVANYTSDIAIDPNSPNHAVVAYGWVVGGAANGWYDGHYNGTSWSWKKSNVTGAINPKDIGRTTFAWADQGSSSRLYALVHNPDHAATGISYSELGGVFMSTNGLAGPWSKIADSSQLQKSGSALDPHIAGNAPGGPINSGYQPGVQAWYNQFLTVDPANAKHVYVGLEEVYETRDAGAHWNTVAPYWNFYFGCWGSDPTADAVGCKTDPHSDQHAVTIAGGRVYVGNDGGLYSRPVNGTYYGGGHGADWVSETQASTPDLLQYYSVGVGRVDAAKVAQTSAHDQAGFGSIISGGLQDNGGSILFADSTGPEAQMGSNFGGDGGDVLVDPNDGCRIVQEYVDLSMRVTNMCAATSDINSFLDLSKSLTRSIRPPESLAQFISPFSADHANINDWLAGGQHVWLNQRGFNIRNGSDWVNLKTLGANPVDGQLRQSTATAANDGRGIVGFCGSCATGSFASGFAIGSLDPSADDWQTFNVSDVTADYADGTSGPLPSRWIAGTDVFKDGDGHTHYLLGFNGFGRRWVEGPGAQVGHVFESTDATGQHWTELDGQGTNSLPDVPVSDVKMLADGSIAAATDLGVFVRDTDGSWHVLGSGLPHTVVTNIEPGPDGFLYAATYGRGIWRLSMSNLPTYAGGDSCQDTYWNTKDEPATTCDGDVPAPPTVDTTSTNSQGKVTGKR